MAVVGSRLATAEAAANALLPGLGHRPVPLAHSDDLERLPDLQALVIASPHETHETWLSWALSRGLHVLCEKPLVWGRPSAGVTAAALARRFQQRGLHLLVNTQWPRALEAFAQLHPEVDLARVEHLLLEMQPPARGVDMLPDSLPHALSLLYALAPHPRPRLDDLAARWGDDEGRTLDVSAVYVAGERRIALDVRLAQGGASPRGFALTLDGRRAERQVDPSTYAMTLVDGPRSVVLPDPMAARAAEFVTRVRDAAPLCEDPSAAFGVLHLEQLATVLPPLALTEIPYP